MRPLRNRTTNVSYCEDSGDEELKEIKKAKKESLRAFSFQSDKSKETTRKGSSARLVVTYICCP